MQEHQPDGERRIGEVTHYWSHLGVAGVRLDADLDVGDRIHVLGHTSDFTQEVGSIELEHQKVTHADAGAEVGVQVAEHVREHDGVYKLADSAEIGEGQDEL